RSHSEMLDRLVVAAHDAALQAVDPKRRRPAFALAAVGSYGRACVGWQSTPEVQFLTGSAPEKIRSIIDAMIDALAEAGITLAYQVATLTEALRKANAELPLATRLLDLRFLAGDAALVTQLRERASTEIFSGAQLSSFLERLSADARARHERIGGSIYL